jgi:hypothetical protein
LANTDDAATNYSFNVVAMRGFVTTSATILVLLAVPLIVFVLGKITGLPPFVCKDPDVYSAGEIAL